MQKEMKNSGIDSVGFIPKDWNVSKVKYNFYRKKAKANDSSPTVLSLARTGVRIRDITNNEGQLAESYYEYNPVAKGDLLLNPMDLYSGANCSYSDVEGVISPAYINLRNYANVCSKYYDYYFKLQYWSMAFFAQGTGISFDNRWTLGTETLMNYPLIVPSYNEQVKIATFLDAKCKKIDDIISKIKQSIDDYKKLKQTVVIQAVTKGIHENRPLKKSGIEWIRDIPENWDIRKGWTILKLLERPVRDDDSVITCFRDGEVTLRSKRREEGFTFSLQEVGYQGIESGDLVVHGMDGFAGAIGISDSRGKATPVLNVLDSTQNKKYIMYFLRSLAYQGVFISLATGIRVRSCDTNWNKLKKLPYIIPPLEEQQEIADFIEKKLLKIDSLIEKKEEFLIEIENYRRTIIYEYVTGKKEVK